MPYAWNSVAIACRSAIALAITAFISNRWLVSGLCVLLSQSHATAQQIGPPPAVEGPNWGDPYKIVTPETAAVGILPSAGGLFAGGPILGVQSTAELDPYATPPTAVELTGPVVGGVSGQPTPIFGLPLVERRPLFPRLSNRIDSRLYLRGEYLLWNVSGMRAPALVTSSPGGTPEDVATVIGQPGTTVLFGGTKLNDGSTSGLLFASGFWITPEKDFALEIEYFGLEDKNDGYTGSSNGSVILGRPYFDIVDGNEAARLVAYPGEVGGNIRVATQTSLRSYLINGKVSLCPSHGPNCNQCGMRDRTDWIIGYRNIRLRDSLSVCEDLSYVLPHSPETLNATDQFQTTNQFNGLQLGVVRRRLLGRAWLASSLRVAIGNNEQTLRVDGSTTTSETGVAQSFSGGLLAQRTNSGTRTRDEFVMVPEVGVRLGVRLTTRLHASIGYSALYLPNAIRASEQIDTDINPGLIPEESDPLIGASRPRVLWIQSDYLAHGLHFGGELHF